MENSYKYFCNKDCQYFPCHEIPEDGNFNCMFCYCPLYPLGKHCGGNFKYIGVHDEIKDCSACNFPHKAESYDQIMDMVKNMRHYYASVRMKEEFLFKRNLQNSHESKRYCPVRTVIVPEIPNDTEG